MAKQRIKLPANFECEDGTCLEKPLSFIVDVPVLTPQVQNIPDAIIDNGNNQITIPRIKEIPESKTEIKEVEKIIKVVPSWQPNYICKGPNCNTKKNPSYSARPKGICSNCGQFTKEAFGTCIWCQSKDIEEIDEDKLNDLGIPTPENNKEDTDEAD